MHNIEVKKLPLIEGRQKRNLNIAFVVVMIVFIGSTYFTGFNPFEILKEQGIFWSFIKDDFMPPDFLKAKGIWTAISITIEMALGSTFIAAVFAFLIAFWGSGTTAPSKFIARVIRAIGSFMRNIPTLVWAFILVVAFGIGTSVGFIAFIIQSFGFLLRAYIETIDEVGIEGLEALEASGASFFQKIVQGVIPAAMPGYISWFLYNVEVNIRHSTIVGMVGGGGIGLVLMSYLKSFKYNVAGGIILIIAAVIILVDLLTNWLRRKVLI